MSSIQSEQENAVNSKQVPQQLEPASPSIDPSPVKPEDPPQQAEASVSVDENEVHPEIAQKDQEKKERIKDLKKMLKSDKVNKWWTPSLSTIKSEQKMNSLLSPFQQGLSQHQMQIVNNLKRQLQDTEEADQEMRELMQKNQDLERQILNMQNDRGAEHTKISELEFEIESLTKQIAELNQQHQTSL